MDKIDVIQWIRDHKTRLTGYITTGIGVLTTLNEPLREFLTKREMAAFTIVMGLAVAYFGHLNASKPSDPPAE